MRVCESRVRRARPDLLILLLFFRPKPSLFCPGSSRGTWRRNWGQPKNWTVIIALLDPKLAWLSLSHHHVRELPAKVRVAMPKTVVFHGSNPQHRHARGCPPNMSPNRSKQKNWTVIITLLMPKLAQISLTLQHVRELPAKVRVGVNLGSIHSRSKITRYAIGQRRFHWVNVHEILLLRDSGTSSIV